MMSLSRLPFLEYPSVFLNPSLNLFDEDCDDLDELCDPSSSFHFLLVLIDDLIWPFLFLDEFDSCDLPLFSPTLLLALLPLIVFAIISIREDFPERLSPSTITLSLCGYAKVWIASEKEGS